MSAILRFQKLFGQPGPDEDKLPSQKPADWRRMLAAIPERNRAAESRWIDDDAMQLVVRKRKPAFLLPPLSWIIRPRLKRTFILDALGAGVWTSCDGRRSVEEIIDVFAGKNRLTFHEARVAVTGYLGGLVKRGAVVMVLEDEETSS